MSAAPGLSVVTGGSRGIGRAVVERLVARGEQVLACGRDESALSELQRQGAGQVHRCVVDVAEPDAVSRVVAAAATIAPVRRLVCAAGVVRYEPVGQVQASSLALQLGVNLSAPLLLTQALAGVMERAGGGAAVFVSSTLALRPAPETLAYAASKAGLLAGMRGLALELSSRGVRVNAVVPGVVDTEMVRAERGDCLDSDARLERLRRLHPLGRLGTVEDVAEAILYLLDAEWVTGTALGVDGGLLLG